jgi:hypothetical protein
VIAGRLAITLTAVLCACNGELRFDEDAPPSADTGPGAEARAGCYADTDCTEPGYAKCDGVLARCVACVADPDCGSGRRCEPTTRRCVTPCSDSTDTACHTAGGDCSDRLKICVACGDDTGCPSRGAPICDPAAGVCVACVTDAQCPLDRPACDRTRGACQ